MPPDRLGTAVLSTKRKIMFDGQFRSRFDEGIEPLGENLRRTGLRADHLTVIGLVMSAAAAVAIANGALRGGLLLLVLGTLPDALDGAVARASGTPTRRGAFFDSVADRVSDSLLLGGIAWYLSTTQPGRIAVLPLAVLALSFLISYERAKAESLGFEARGGVMERLERIVAIGFALLFDTLLVPVLWIMALLTAFTVAQRFFMVWRQESVPAPTADAVRTEGAVQRRPRRARRRSRRRTGAPGRTRSDRFRRS